MTELLRRAGAEVGHLRAGDRLPACATPVLVTRSTAAGLGAVGDLLAVWHPDVPPPWLVVVADLPAPPPAAVRYRLRALSGQVRGVVTVPYLWPLRAASRLDEVGETRAVRRAARDLAGALAGVGR